MSGAWARRDTECISDFEHLLFIGQNSDDAHLALAAWTLPPSRRSFGGQAEGVNLEDAFYPPSLELRRDKCTRPTRMKERRLALGRSRLPVAAGA